MGDLANVRAEIERDYKVRDGVIRDFGQFEAEPVYVAALWSFAMEQGNAFETCTDLNGYENYVFEAEPELKAAFPETAASQ